MNARLAITGTASGVGKTTITAALLARRFVAAAAVHAANRGVLHG